MSPSDREAGQISILLIGMVALTLTIIMAVVGVTSVQLSRIQLLDAADAASLDASDALAQEQVYDAGVGSGPPVSNDTVVEAAAAHLDRRPMPPRVRSWVVGSGTGTPDGRTAVVTVTGQAEVPVLSPVLDAFGGGVSITVTSTARSEIDP